MSVKLEHGGDHHFGSFRTTQWTVVLTAAQANTPAGRAALAVLCERYWPPLYTYIRRRGYGRPEAEDLTQAFFEKLLAEQQTTLGRANPGRGKFRAFLLGVLRHFLSDHSDRILAAKRGGGTPVVRLDVDVAEGRLDLEAGAASSPERAFEREWALTVLRRGIERLRVECAAEGKDQLFAHLRPHLSGDESRVPYREVAARLNMSEGAVKVALHRLRKRYGECIRQEVADTLGTASELEEEIQYLFRALQP